MRVPDHFFITVVNETYKKMIRAEKKKLLNEKKKFIRN